MEPIVLQSIMRTNWKKIVEIIIFQIRELKVKEFLKSHAGKRIVFQDIADKQLREDVKRYMMDFEENAKKLFAKEGVITTIDET